MTCVHCSGAEYLFDTKEANKTTKKLLSILISENIQGFSHLDIGGGIGTIQLELLRNGISKTTGIDALTAYLKVAEKWI